MPNAIALLGCNTVTLAAQRPQRRAKKLNKSEKKQASSNSVGFGMEKKEPLWRCVDGCGACCKLDKGPAFATPEEIFDEPSDIQVPFVFITCTLSVCEYELRVNSINI